MRKIDELGIFRVDGRKDDELQDPGAHAASKGAPHRAGCQVKQIRDEE
ncbi:hypothetical protein [Streptomyces sp. NBC_01614]